MDKDKELLEELYENVMSVNDPDFKKDFWDSLAITCEFCSDEEYQNKETPFHKGVKDSFPKFIPIFDTLQKNKEKYFKVIYEKLNNDGFITKEGICRIN